MEISDILGNAVRSALGPQAAVYALAAIGLNVHYGYTGLFNFGQVGFMALGAYGVAITVITFGGPFWLGIVVSLLLGVAFSLLLGVPTLRLRADYFAIVTIAAAEILRLVIGAIVSTDLTGGPYGLQGFAGPFYALNPFPRGDYGVGLLRYTERSMWSLAFIWTLAIVGAFIVRRAISSPWGRVLRSIREDEDAARSLGKNVFNYKMQSLVIGGLFGIVAGIMFALQGASATPLAYKPEVTFYLYAILILGGAATTVGPLLGSIIFWFLLSGVEAYLRLADRLGQLPEFLSGNSVGAARDMTVGLLIVLLLVFRPQGLLGNRREMMLDA